MTPDLRAAAQAVVDAVCVPQTGLREKIVALRDALAAPPEPDEERCEECSGLLDDNGECDFIREERAETARIEKERQK